uniref:Uncharacterized protein n=1 Tax=Marseillevirus sp. TaxID=2809551 RepID=A0AA96EP71_9VIRU|nr:hypothetical protein MarDSR_130 [Marseillevirus sp.]
MSRLLETIKDFLERYNPSEIFAHQEKIGKSIELVVVVSSPDLFFYWTEHETQGRWWYSFPTEQKATDAKLLLDFITKRIECWEEQHKVEATD